MPETSFGPPGRDHAVDHQSAHPLISEGLARDYTGTLCRVVLVGMLRRAIDIRNEDFSVLVGSAPERETDLAHVHIESQGTSQSVGLPGPVIDFVRLTRGNLELELWGPALPDLGPNPPLWNPVGRPGTIFVANIAVPFETLWAGRTTIGEGPPAGAESVAATLFRCVESVLLAHTDWVTAHESLEARFAHNFLGISRDPFLTQSLVAGASLFAVTYEGGMQSHWYLPGDSAGPAALDEVPEPLWEHTMQMATGVFRDTYQGRLIRAHARIHVALNEMSYDEVVLSVQQVIDMHLTEMLRVVLREDGWPEDDMQRACRGPVRETLNLLRSHLGLDSSRDWQWAGAGAGGRLALLYEVRRQVTHAGRRATMQEALDAEDLLSTVLRMTASALIAAAEWHPKAFADLLPLDAAAELDPHLRFGVEQAAESADPPPVSASDMVLDARTCWLRP